MKKALFAAFIAANVAAAPLAFADAKKGEELFKDKGATKCVVCHAIGKKVVGPDLAGVGKRHTHAWLVKWISDTQGTWTSADPETAELKARVKKQDKPKSAHSTPPISGAQANDIADFLMAQ
ncbi:MAG: cytochrome c [Nitrospinae bacterium]|nr:cytochrome c [Nitrospinota bacterium]